MYAFVYYFIVSTELHLLGDEHGGRDCVDTLDTEDTQGLRQALAYAELVVADFGRAPTTLPELIERIRVVADNLRSDASIHGRANLALQDAFSHAFDRAGELMRAGPGQRKPPQQTEGPDSDRPLRALRRWSRYYLDRFEQLVDFLAGPDGSLDEDAVRAVFACTDIGMGMLYHLGGHLLHAETNPFGLVRELNDQLRSSAVEDGGHHVERTLTCVYDCALVALDEGVGA
ncbi:hypothetical protein [Piscinibacter defluvii]|uniref:hypothetical protein n=1 Tax=Piscinibacter defluvii TaxID=1796922 RepID=UPI000FDF53FB|nr:hypothetical protein [Piscinibacter defluvii]